MPNRRTDKKLRARVLARMATTGETYQQALAQLRTAHARRPIVERTPIAPHALYQRAVALQTIADRESSPARRESLQLEASAVMMAYATARYGHSHRMATPPPAHRFLGCMLHLRDGARTWAKKR